MAKTFQQERQEALDAYFDAQKRYPSNHPKRIEAFNKLNKINKKSFEQKQKPSRPLLEVAGENISNIFGNIGKWLTSPAPNFNITTDPTGRPLTQQGLKPGKYQFPSMVDETKPNTGAFLLPGTYSTEPLPNNMIPPGKVQRPLMGGNGEIVGYVLENAPTQPQRPTTPSTRPTTPGAGFPSVTADTAERREGATQVQQQQQESLSAARREAEENYPQNLLPVDLNQLAERQQAAEQERQQNVIDEEKAQRKTQRQIIEAMLTQAGFTNASNALINKAIEAYRQSPDSNYVILQLRETQEYKERFSAIDKLRENNPTFSEADYIAQEKSYATAARDLPGYLQPKQQDFARFMELGVSPMEYQARVQAANQAAANANPFFKEALMKNYGATNDDIVAIFLDPEKAEEEILKIQNVAAFDASLLQNKLNISTSYLEQLSDMGKTVTEVEKAGQVVAGQTGLLGTLSAIEGTEALTEEEQLRGTLGEEELKQEAQGLRSRERARFGGTSAGTRMFGRSVSGNI